MRIRGYEVGESVREFDGIAHFFAINALWNNSAPLGSAKGDVHAVNVSVIVDENMIVG